LISDSVFEKQTPWKMKNSRIIGKKIRMQTD
jgi:hypothetical protein